MCKEIRENTASGVAQSVWCAITGWTTGIRFQTKAEICFLQPLRRDRLWGFLSRTERDADHSFLLVPRLRKSGSHTSPFFQAPFMAYNRTTLPFFIINN
jgi:hypothetical protein